MNIGVVVIAAGRYDHLTRTLAGLARQTQPPDDIVVVDMDPRRSVAATVTEPARTVSPPGRATHSLPLAAARNAGVAAVHGDGIVFLDVDCIAGPGLVEAYGRALERHPSSLVCGPVRYLRRAWLDVAADRGEGAFDAASLDAASDVHPARPVVPAGQTRLGADYELFWSLSFAATRGTWTSVGGFDEHYVGYGAEDTDFAYRARDLGIPIAWLGDGVAYHQWHPPTRHDTERIPEIVANASTFRRRWGAWPMEGWLRELHDNGLVHFDPNGDVLRVISR